jgi:hypothetical protein
MIKSLLLNSVNRGVKNFQLLRPINDQDMRRLILIADLIPLLFPQQNLGYIRMSK